MKNMRWKKVLAACTFLAVFAGITAVVMLLWNAIIPAVIGWGVMSYLQAMGLMVLCRLLFGGFGRKGGMMMHPVMYGHMHKMKRKMRGMSRDQRCEFIRNHMAGFAHTCGKDGGDFFDGGPGHHGGAHGGFGPWGDEEAMRKRGETVRDFMSGQEQDGDKGSKGE